MMLLSIKNGNNAANRYLSAFLFFTSIYCIGLYFLLYESSANILAIFLTCFPSTYLLVGPLSYFYVRSIVNDDSKLTKRDYLHFLIFIITFLGSLPFLFTTWEYKLSVAQTFINGNFFSLKVQTNALIPKKINHLIRPIQILIYTFLNWQLLAKQRKSASTYANKSQYKYIYKWLLGFNSILTVGHITYLYGVFNMIKSQTKPEFLSNFSYVLTTLLILYSLANLCIFLFPKIMYGLPIEHINKSTSVVLDSTINVKDVGLFTLNNNVATHSPIETTPTLFLFTLEYIDEMNTYLDNCIKELGFLDIHFKMDGLCKESDIPLHHWTYYFNEIKRQTFIEWKNVQRIEHAKKLIAEDFLKSQTFESLAQRCGFSTQSTFIRVFKLHTGLSPREFTKSA